jgi:hypothetical protein
VLCVIAAEVVDAVRWVLAKEGLADHATPAKVAVAVRTVTRRRFKADLPADRCVVDR